MVIKVIMDVRVIRVIRAIRVIRFIRVRSSYVCDRVIHGYNDN